MSYLVLLKFGSIQNADFFVTRPQNQPFQPTNAEVPTGYTAPTPGIGSPGSSAVTSTWVTIQVPDLNIFLPGNQLYGYDPQFIMNNNTRETIYYGPNIDPNSLTIKQGDNTVILNGVPPGETQPPSNYPLDPTLFPPYYDNPDLRIQQQRYLQQISDQQPQIHGEPLPPPINLFDPNLPDIMPIDKYGQWLVPTDFTPNPFPGDTIIDSPKYRFGQPEPNPPGIDPNTGDPIAIDPRSYETQQQFLPFEMWPLNRPSPEPRPKPPTAPLSPTQISGEGDGGGLVGLPPSIFVLYVPDTGPWYSLDAISWAKAPTSVDSLPRLGLDGPTPGQGPAYYNGLWAFNYVWNNGSGPFTAIIYSYSGVNWNTGFIPTASQIAAGVFFMVALTPPGTGVAPNTILLTNRAQVPANQQINITVPCFNPPSTANNVLHGDSDLFNKSNILVDPAQGAGALTFGATGFYAQNSLPRGITAVRFTEPSGTAEQVEYATSPITQSVVNANFAGTNFVVSFNQASIAGGTYLYGRRSGTSSTLVS